ncbi:hypothetical protein JADG_005801 [Aureobasidium aubasidani]|nr:hypothetical protein JADG_005801 [Aureobasidium pullulans]
MHSIKHQARNIAWRYNDGESNYNPFARRSRSYVGRPEDEENNLQRRHTADQVMSDSSIRRNDMRNVDNADFAYPHHANTAPPESSASSDAPTSNGTLVGQSDIKPSKEKESIPLDRDNSRSMSEKPHTESEHKPRKRLALMNLLGQPDRTKTDSSDLERSDTGDTKKRRPKISIVSQFKATILGSWVNVLLVCVPIGFALRYSHANGYAVFIVNFIAIIPLAAMLSFATEELALYVGETLGGLLNASFGNATELIVSIIALAQNKILIVQTSLIGSMLSNLLLVLGMCFFFGGINRVTQHFNITVAQTASSMLAVSIGSLIIPTAFQRFGNNPQGGVGPISRGTSVILLLVYLAYLTFQLKTHVEIYNTPSQKSEKKKGSAREKGDTLMGLARIGAGTAASAGGQVNQSNLVYEEEEEETPALSVIGALVTLTIATVFIAFNSEFMVSGIDYIVEHGNISEEFVGLILVPIVGNAAEHATAVTVAIKDKMDLAIGVAVGSSMQIALLVLPLMVVISWCGLGNDPMTLDFDGFQVAVLFIAVLLVNYLIQDGESHWLEGILLMATYIIIAVIMSFTNRKIKKFNLPDGVQSIVVEDEPEQENSNEDHEPKSENPIKTEPEDMDINEYMGANTSTPYVEITTEPDVQAGAEEEIQSAQESTSVSATPTVPIKPVGLGNSILNAPKVVQVSTIQSDDQKEALQRQQAALYAQMASYGGTGDDDGSDFDPQEDSEDPIAQEFQFMEAKHIYLLKKQNGELTQDDEMDFLQRAHAYDKRKRELHTLLEEIDQESLFVPEDLSRKSARKTRKRSISEFASDSENSTMPSSRSSSKKAKTTKSQRKARVAQPPSRPNLNGHNNFWESIDAANQMNTEPTVEGVAPNTGGRSAALRGIKARANAPSEAKKAAALDAQRLKKANQLEKAVERQAASGETAISMIHAFRSVMKTQRTRTEARVANGIQPDISASPGIIDELDEGADDVDELRQPDVIEENQDERGTGGEHGRNVNLGGYVESLRRSTNLHIFSERSVCCKCKRPAREPVMASCYHFYCHSHMDDMLHEAAAARLDNAFCVKERCGKAITKNDVIDPEAAIKPKWLDADGNVLPSTKTLAVKSQVINWLDDDKSCRIIIFCQWKSFLGMLSRICEVEGWGYTTLHGSMNKKARDASIEKFKTDPETRILIATLKTGGQGLNLTCACYTINVDPYWNTAGEIQAFSRTYRIGQEKETEFVNLTLAGTVDEHMNAIKLRKKLEIDQAFIQVNAGHKRMTMEELLKTFEPTEDSDEDSTSD